jgi:hypothetical protein
MQYRSAEGVVEAFRIPNWGQVAESEIPGWLVFLMQRGTIQIHPAVGGLSYKNQAGLPGDYVIFHIQEDGRIEFCQASEFTSTYTLLEDRQAA